MRANEFITEKRKNPKQNPKTSINDIIINAFHNAPSLDNLDEVNCFVSFTSVDKLGINPKSEWDTPIGIYAYPASFVINQTNTDTAMDYLPFAGDQAFVNIFQANGNIINLKTLSNQDLVVYYQKIADYFTKNANMPWKDAVDIVEHYINQSDRKAKFDSYAGGRLWYVTMKVAQELSTSRSNDQGTNTHIVWNHLFRYIGIDGAYDPGIGIIHTSERNQAVFFSKDAITNIKRYNNKYSPDSVKDMQQHGRFMKETLHQLNSAKTLEQLSKLLIQLSDNENQQIGSALDEYRVAGWVQRMKNTPAKQELLKTYANNRTYDQSHLVTALKTTQSMDELEKLMVQTSYQAGLKNMGHNPLKGQFLQKYPTIHAWQKHLDDLYNWQ